MQTMKAAQALLSFLVLCSSTVSAATSFIVVDSIANSVIDTTQPKYWEAGVAKYFPAGAITLSPYAGGWTAWSSSDPNFAGYMWNVFIYQETTGSKYQLGDWTQKYATPAEALYAYDEQLLAITQPIAGYLWFFIEDGFPSDNAGTVTVKATTVPEPSSAFLLGAGFLAGLGSRRTLAALQTAQRRIRP